MRNGKQLVVGMGEVGQALSEVLDIPGRDIEGEPYPLEVLHIAYPWSDDFVRNTNGYWDAYNASLVVVHSTVPVGTCDKYGWTHSPVRGRHPHLAEGLRTFVKLFGGKGAMEAAKRWPYRIQVVSTAADTEAAKLWELAQFGIQVRVNQAVYEWSEDNGLDPEVVYRFMAETYNDGYARLGEHQFVRPVLDYMPGPIGGHCILENSKLIEHPLIDIIYQDSDEES